MSQVHHKTVPVDELADEASTILRVRILKTGEDVVVEKTGKSGSMKLNYRTVQVLEVLKGEASSHTSGSYKVLRPPASGFHPLETDESIRRPPPGAGAGVNFKPIHIDQILSVASREPLNSPVPPGKSYYENALVAPASSGVKEALFFGSNYDQDLQVFFGVVDDGLVEVSQYPSLVAALKIRTYFDALRTRRAAELNAAIDKNPSTINSIDPRWGSPLQFAARYGNKELVEILLKRGAKKETRNAAGDDALQDLIRSGFLENVEALVALGFDINSKNADGKSTLQMAQEKGDQKTVGILNSAAARK